MRFPIRWKLLLAVALPVLAAYVVMLVGVLTHLEGRERLALERRMTETARRYAGAVDAELRELAQVARSTARFIETAGMPSRETLFAQLRANVDGSPLCYGAAIAFEPPVHDASVELFAPYAFRAGDTIETLDIAEEAYDYTDPKWEWYDRPRRTGAAGWTAPYFDEGAGNVLMTTFTVPFQLEGRFAGTATVDIVLEPLRRAVGARFKEDLDLYVITGSGDFVYHNDPTRTLTGNVLEIADREGRDDLRALALAMTAGESGVRTVERDGDPQWVFFAPIPSPAWSLAARVTEDEALAPVRAEVTWFATVLGATLAVICLSIALASTWISRPVGRLTAAVRRVAGGDLDAEAPDGHRADEIGDLSRTFNRMRADLKCLITRRADEQAAGRDALIFALAKLAESRDTDTGQHLERICRYVEILANALRQERDDIDDHWVRTITRTAALHDIGKVGIEDAVLQKPGRLTEEEHRVIQKHTTIGGDTLLAIKRHYDDDTFLVTATEIAFAHHERWDGTGYPFGLAEDGIALSARIVAVADVYDALTSKRVYKPGMSHEDARTIIVEGSGTHFDPAIVAIFERVEAEIRAAAAKLHD